jgi:hypothetical protein
MFNTINTLFLFPYLHNLAGIFGRFRTIIPRKIKSVAKLGTLLENARIYLGAQYGHIHQLSNGSTAGIL